MNAKQKAIEAQSPLNTWKKGDPVPEGYRVVYGDILIPIFPPQSTFQTRCMCGFEGEHLQKRAYELSHEEFEKRYGKR